MSDRGRGEGDVIKLPEWITKYWIEWVFGLVTAGLLAYIRSIARQIKHEREEQQALRNGVKALLKINLDKECERCQRDGWCGSVKRSTIDDMYKAYKGLGGNGGTKALVEQTLALPAVEPGKGE